MVRHAETVEQAKRAYWTAPSQSQSLHTSQASPDADTLPLEQPPPGDGPSKPDEMDEEATKHPRRRLGLGMATLQRPSLQSPMTSLLQRLRHQRAWQADHSLRHCAFGCAPDRWQCLRLCSSSIVEQPSLLANPASRFRCWSQKRVDSSRMQLPTGSWVWTAVQLRAWEAA